MPLEHKFPAKQLIPAHIRGAEKLGEDLKMWFLNADGPLGCVTILKHEEIAKERLWTIKVCFFSKGRPENKGAAHRLFCPIVEIVAKGRADLGFGFDGSDQCSPTNNEEVPFFGGSEEPGKLNGLLCENAIPGDSGMCDKVCKKGNEPVHLGTAGDCAAETLIGFPPCFLFPPLGGPCLPVVADFFRRAIGDLFHNFVIIHADISLSDLSVLFQWSTPGMCGCRD